MEAQVVQAAERPKQRCRFCRTAFDQPMIEQEKKITKKICPCCGEVLWVGRLKKCSKT